MEEPDSSTSSVRQEPPWLGRANKLDGLSAFIISHYDHRIVSERKLDGADVTLISKIKYKTKYEPEDKERMMAETGFNPSRLGDYLINSDSTPDDIKEQIARKMRSKTTNGTIHYCF